MDYWIDRYLRLTEDTECPTIFHEWTAISIVASVLQRKPYFIINIDKIFPNMYVAIVGPAGSRKGTAIRFAKKFMNEIGISRCAESITKEQLIAEMASKSAQKEPKSLMEGMIFSPLAMSHGDLAQSISDNEYSALTLVASELATFLNSDDSKFFTMLTEWFDCEDLWQYKTKHQGSYSIKNIWFNILGAITPLLVANTLSATAFGSGLVSRFIFVYADEKSKLIMLDDDSVVGGSAASTKEHDRLFKHLVEELDSMQHIVGRFLMEQDVSILYTQWRMKNETDPPFGRNSRFEHYIDRRPMHLIKLCMIYACMRDNLDVNNLVITRHDFERATELLHRTENYMGLAFRGVGKSDTSVIVARIVKTLVMLPVGTEIKVNDLYSEFLSDISFVEFKTLIDSIVYANAAIRRIDKQTWTEYLKFNEARRADYMKGVI